MFLDRKRFALAAIFALPFVGRSTAAEMFVRAMPEKFAIDVLPGVEAFTNEAAAAELKAVGCPVDIVFDALADNKFVLREKHV